MKLRLTYQNPTDLEKTVVVVDTPVVIGRESAQLPTEVKGQSAYQVLVADTSVAPYHALVEDKQGQMTITDMVRDYPIGLSQDRFKVGEIKFTFAIVPGVAATNSNDYMGETANDQVSRCQKMVGFLFKHRCDRTSPVGCPHCGEKAYEYDSDYICYENYGDYSEWGDQYYRDRHSYQYDYDNRRVEFTEADNTAFAQEGDLDFEQDYSAS